MYEARARERPKASPEEGFDVRTRSCLPIVADEHEDEADEQQSAADPDGADVSELRHETAEACACGEDPPYFDAESLYAVDFPKEKHEELHHILSQCKGYIVVSYNDCPFIRSLYGDFYILAFRRNNPLSQKPGATYGELIITNYDPRPYIQPQFSMFPAEIENGDLVLVHEPACGSLREINLARREKELGH